MWVADQRQGLGGREPIDRADALFVLRRRRRAAGVQQEELDLLIVRHPVLHDDIRDPADERAELAAGPGLFAHLADGGGLLALAGLEVSLGQRPAPVLVVNQEDQRGARAVVAIDDTTGRAANWPSRFVAHLLPALSAADEDALDHLLQAGGPLRERGRLGPLTERGQLPGRQQQAHQDQQQAAGDAGGVQMQRGEAQVDLDATTACDATRRA